MSALILSPRAFLKSDRPIILPGWGALPIDRPRRRSARWGKILTGRAGLTRLQPGSCCGCGSVPSCLCGSCDVPESGLSASILTGSGYPGGSGLTASGALTFYSGPCQWLSGCLGPIGYNEFGTPFFGQVVMTCASGPSGGVQIQWTVYAEAGPVCIGGEYGAQVCNPATTTCGSDFLATCIGSYGTVTVSV